MEYPEARVTDDWQEKLKSVPKQAWWADDDEPMYRFPPGQSFTSHTIPHRVALGYGLIVEIEAQV